MPIFMQIKELGHVVFYVSNLKRSADFYRDILGFLALDFGLGGERLDECEGRDFAYSKIGPYGFE